MAETDQALWYLENIDMNDIFCPNKLESNMDSDSDHLKEFKKNDFIFMVDEVSDKVFFIVSGRIKIGTYSEKGKEITKAILSKGEVFGELSIINSDNARRDFAQAMEPSVVCAMSTEQMKMLMKNHSSLSLFFMKIIGSRVLEMEKRLESMVFKDSRTRIVDYIIELVAKKGQRVGYEFVVRNFLTHQEIANITATSRQTVTTTLNELKNKDLITFNRKRLLVRDLEMLKGEVAVHV